MTRRREQARWPARLLTIAVALAWSDGPHLQGQVTIVAQPGAAPVVVEAAPATPMVNPAAPQGAVPSPPAGRPGTPPPGDKAGAGQADGQKPAEPAKIIARPPKPRDAPDARELQVRPGADGQLRFHFRGQPWPDVLEWLAEVSGMSLDWQELPADYLNLSTQRDYSVADARDLINRHLLARGFTLLQNGELLTVANIAKLDPGLVPRVEAAELTERQPHEFVKVSFKLEWLLAEQAVEELKPMLSPNGKLSALKSTNRLEAIDAVVNLRQIWDVLSKEQSKDGQERLVKEFSLKHTRAAEIQTQLQSLLGLEGQKSKSLPLTPEQQQMEMQQQMMMAQMQQQRGGQPMPQQKKQDNVFLVVNTRRNSIVANAPPDRMAVIEQAVATLDVPAERSEAFLANAGRMRVYRLAALDPEPLVKTLLESGNLDPNTKLEVDRKNKAILADASLIDHATIRMLIDKLDASGRRFEMYPLRKLEADYVAGTVEFMMGGGEKEKSSDRRGYEYFGYWGSRRGGEQETTTDRFRVDADVEFNRLLIWANDVELAEVENLLVKLGEISPPGGNRQRVRVLETLDPKEAAELLERLRRNWPGIAPNPLLMPAVPAPATPVESESEKTSGERPPSTPVPDPASSPKPVGKSAKFTPASARSSAGLAATQELLALAEPSPESDMPESRPMAPPAQRVPSTASSGQHDAPPVQIFIRPDGRIVLQSDDTEALDALEALIDQLTPPRRDFQIFQLKHAPAYWVKLNLDEFFEEKESKSSNNSGRGYYFYDYPPPSQNQDGRHRLSKRRPLKFISDRDTNTILVQGADAAQLKTIRDLIELYDVPEPSDSQSARVSGVFSLKFSKAKVVADAVKDVYRDLLSSNDRALTNNPENANKPPTSRTYITNFGGEGDDSPKKEKTPVSFKGKLSLGVDELSNTLLVSTEGENLFRNVSKMIEDLDNAARPVGNLRVIQIGGHVNPDNVKKALTEMFKKPPQRGPQPGQPPQQPFVPPQGQPQVSENDD